MCACIVLGATAPATASLIEVTFEGTQAAGEWSSSADTDFADNGPTLSGSESLQFSSLTPTTTTIYGPTRTVGTAADQVDRLTISGDFKLEGGAGDGDTLRFRALRWYTDGTSSGTYDNVLVTNVWTGQWQTLSAEIVAPAGTYFKELTFQVAQYAAGPSAGGDGFDLRADNLVVAVPEPASLALIGVGSCLMLLHRRR